jgi:RNA polymerase sigma-70 factor (ECF subfamily)
MAVGQPDPFAAALAAQLPALRRYAIALVRDPTAADDLIQDCIERALRQAAKLEDMQRIGGWLRTILHNLYVDDLRRQRRKGTRVELETLDLVRELPPRDHAAIIDFDRAMGKLSVEHRQVLLLVGLEGLNYREVADELAVPIGTVMSRLARAREKLRHVMEENQRSPSSIGEHLRTSGKA